MKKKDKKNVDKVFGELYHDLDELDDFEDLDKEDYVEDDQIDDEEEYFYDDEEDIDEYEQSYEDNFEERVDKYMSTDEETRKFLESPYKLRQKELRDRLHAKKYEPTPEEFEKKSKSAVEAMKANNAEYDRKVALLKAMGKLDEKNKQEEEENKDEDGR